MLVALSVDMEGAVAAAERVRDLRLHAGVLGDREAGSKPTGGCVRGPARRRRVGSRDPRQPPAGTRSTSRRTSLPTGAPRAVARYDLRARRRRDVPGRVSTRAVQGFLSTARTCRGCGWRRAGELSSAAIERGAPRSIARDRRRPSPPGDARVRSNRPVSGCPDIRQRAAISPGVTPDPRRASTRSARWRRGERAAARPRAVGHGSGCGHLRGSRPNGGDDGRGDGRRRLERTGRSEFAVELESWRASREPLAPP